MRILEEGAPSETTSLQNPEAEVPSTQDPTKTKFEQCVKNYAEWPTRITPHGITISFLIYFPNIKTEADNILQNSTPEQLNSLFSLKIEGLEKGIHYEVQYQKNYGSIELKLYCVRTEEDRVYELEISSSATSFSIEYPGTLENRSEFIVIDKPKKVTFYIENTPSETMIKQAAVGVETVKGAVQITTGVGVASTLTSTFFPFFGAAIFIRTLQTFDILSLQPFINIEYGTWSDTIMFFIVQIDSNLDPRLPESWFYIHNSDYFQKSRGKLNFYNLVLFMNMACPIWVHIYLLLFITKTILMSISKFNPSGKRRIWLKHQSNCIKNLSFFLHGMIVQDIWFIATNGVQNANTTQDMKPTIIYSIVINYVCHWCCIVDIIIIGYNNVIIKYPLPKPVEKKNVQKNKEGDCVNSNVNKATEELQSTKDNDNLSLGKKKTDETDQTENDGNKIGQQTQLALPLGETQAQVLVQPEDQGCQNSDHLEDQENQDLNRSSDSQTNTQNQELMNENGYKTNVDSIDDYIKDFINTSIKEEALYYNIPKFYNQIMLLRYMWFIVCILTMQNTPRFQIMNMLLMQSFQFYVLCTGVYRYKFQKLWIDYVHHFLLESTTLIFQINCLVISFDPEKIIINTKISKTMEISCIVCLCIGLFNEILHVLYHIICSVISIVKSFILRNKTRKNNVIMQEKIAQLMLNNHLQMNPLANLNEDVVGIEHDDNVANQSLQVIEEKKEQTIFKSIIRGFDNGQQDDSIKTATLRAKKNDNNRNLPGKINGDKNTDEKGEPRIIVKQIKKNRIVPCEAPEPQIIPQCNEEIYMSKDQDPIQSKLSKKQRRQSKTEQTVDTIHPNESTPPRRKSDEAKQKKTHASERISERSRSLSKTISTQGENSQSESKPSPNKNIKPRNKYISKKYNVINNNTNIEQNFSRTNDEPNSPIIDQTNDIRRSFASTSRSRRHHNRNLIKNKLATKPELAQNINKEDYNLKPSKMSRSEVNNDFVYSDNNPVNDRQN